MIATGWAVRLADGITDDTHKFSCKRLKPKGQKVIHYVVCLHCFIKHTQPQKHIFHIDPLGQPTVTAGRDLVRPSFPTLQNLAKQSENSDRCKSGRGDHWWHLSYFFPPCHLCFKNSPWFVAIWSVPTSNYQWQKKSFSEFQCKKYTRCCRFLCPFLQSYKVKFYLVIQAYTTWT